MQVLKSEIWYPSGTCEIGILVQPSGLRTHSRTHLIHFRDPFGVSTYDLRNTGFEGYGDGVPPRGLFGAFIVF